MRRLDYGEQQAARFIGCCGLLGVVVTWLWDKVCERRRARACASS